MAKHFDYREDPFGAACLKESEKSKGDIGFGAVLVKNGRIIGRGWNRRAVPRERTLLTHVDYAIHAEQACIADALFHGEDIRGSEVYVLGEVRTGSRRGSLTIRPRKVFICKKCPPTLMRFRVPVNVPCVEGWVQLTPEQAVRTAAKMCGKGYWKKFYKKERLQ